MRRWICVALLAIALPCVAEPAPAQAPQEGPAARDLLGRIGQAGQQIAERAGAAGDLASDLVLHAMDSLGVPYRRGGESATRGFDCSGFVRAVYEQTIGLVLPRRANEQAAATETIDKKDLQPGDLVFFNTMRRAFSHVGIYVGDGKFVHAPKPGAKVRIESLSAGYWLKRFDGARRVVTGEPQAPQESSGGAP